MEGTISRIGDGGIMTATPAPADADETRRVRKPFKEKPRAVLAAGRPSPCGGHPFTADSEDIMRLRPRPSTTPGWRGIAVGCCVLAATSTLAQGPASRPGGGLRKPQITDTVRANVYADNWFMLYVNGELVAVDSIAFIPHNVVSVDILPRYPMTIAVLARDNADPKTGMEYANSQIGDGGFILKFGDGTVTDGSWKARCFSRGPIDGDLKNPRVESEPLPENWFAVDFDDTGWSKAREYSETEIDPKKPYYEADFKGAKFIWTDDVRLDNTVVFRKTIAVAPDGRERPDFSRINDVVPDGPPKGPGGRRPPPGGRPR